MAVARKKKSDKGTGAKRQASNDDGTGLVAVPLSDDQIKHRSEDLASEIKKLEAVEQKKAIAADKFNAEIKIHRENISRLAEEIDSRTAMVEAQEALKFGEPSEGTGTGNRGRRQGAAAAKAAELREGAGQ